MKRALSLGLVTFLSLASFAQKPTSQTARQALLEMFFSKTPGTLVKHLPAATLAALEKSGAMANLQQYSLMANQVQSQGQNLQTFETGSILLSGENPKTGQKFEVTVVSDALHGDRDDIALSFHIYKDGEVERIAFMPQMTFSMKQEEHIWKLNEISVTVHVALADPDLLKTITEKMRPQMMANGGLTPQRATPVSYSGSDAQVLAAMRSILAAESTYAASYPAAGFTCTLSNLGGFGGGEQNEHQAMLIDSGLAGGKRYGFVFAISGCRGNPANSFELTAAPNSSAYGRKAYCTDQSGMIRSSDDGNPATCLAKGTLVQ